MPQKRKVIKRATKKAVRPQEHPRLSSKARSAKKSPKPGGAKAGKGTVRAKQYPRTAAKARGGRKSVKSGAVKAGPSRKSIEPHKRAQIDRVSELELEAEGSELANEIPAAPGSDFEGLSQVEDVDSESVDELVEEGNVFEYGAVAGVEKADDRDGKTVRTRQLLEDDVPREYDDMD